MSKQIMPEAWASAKLGDLCVKTEKRKPEGNFIYIDINAIDNKNQIVSNPKKLASKDAPSRARKVVVPDDIIFSTVRPYLKNIAIVPELESQIVSTAFCVLRTPTMDIRYVFNYVRSDQFLILIEPHQKGASYPAVTDKILLEQTIPIPPLGEQRRIVAKIESTQEKIRAIETNMSRAEELIGTYREALLQRAFRGQLVPQNPNDEPVCELLKRIQADCEMTDRKKKKKDDLPPIKPNEIPFEIPKAWEWVRLGSISRKIVDGTHHTPKYKTSGVHFISAKDMNDGVISFENTKFISVQEHSELIKRSHPEKGDVLCTKSGTIGRTAVVPGNCPPFSIFESVALIKPELGIDSNYLELSISRYVNSHAGAGRVKGAAVKHFHLEDLREAIIPLPPMNEQIRIAKEFLLQDQRILSLKTMINKTNVLSALLRREILRSAFAGKLVVQVESEGTGQELLRCLSAKASEEKTQSGSKPTKRQRERENT